MTNPASVIGTNPQGFFGITPLGNFNLVAGERLTLDQLSAQALRNLQGDMQSVFCDASLATKRVIIRSQSTRQYAIWPRGSFGWQPLLLKMPDRIELICDAAATVNLQVATGVVPPGLFKGDFVDSSEASTVTTVNAASAATALLAANVQRQGASFFNDSPTFARVLLSSTGVVSATNFSYRMQPYSTLETPYDYGGAISAIWDYASGAMRITEYD